LFAASSSETDAETLMINKTKCPEDNVSGSCPCKSLHHNEGVIGDFQGIYVYAFDIPFYLKQLEIHLKFTVHAFPGNQTHDLSVANAIQFSISPLNLKLTKLYIYIHTKVLNH